MTTKPLPPHGTTARATGRPSTGIKGCTCQPCRAAANAYAKRRNYLNTTGRPLTVPPTKARIHLETLFEHGAGWTQLVAATGHSSSVLAGIRKGHVRTIHRTTETRILAVEPGSAQPPRRHTSVVGTRRRIQALMAAGHTLRTIAAHAESLDISVIGLILAGKRDEVTFSTARRIEHAYTVLAGTTGNNVIARNRAAANGWPDPTWWEDYGHIDDTTFNPASVDERSTREQALAEDWEFLARQGYTREQAADRLRVPRAYLDATITRYRNRLARTDMEPAA